MKKYRVIATLAACLLVQAASAEVVLYSYKGDISRCEIPVSVIRRHLEEQPYYEIQRGTCPYIRIVDDEVSGQNLPPTEPVPNPHPKMCRYRTVKFTVQSAGCF